MKTPMVSSATSFQRLQTSLQSPMPRLPRSNVYSTRDPANPSASVHRKRFFTPSLTLKFLCAGCLNPGLEMFGNGAVMPSPEALEPPTGLSFGDLIDWHLRRGTRPPGSDRQGEPWKRAAFANDVRVSDKQVRNWIANKSLPNDTITIERVLFGRSQEQRIAWRMELRDALRRTR